MLKLYKEDLAAVALTAFIVFLIGSIADGWILVYANTISSIDTGFNITLAGVDIFLTVLLFVLFIFSKKLSENNDKKEYRIPFITSAAELSGYAAVTSVVAFLKNILIIIQPFTTIGGGLYGIGLVLFLLFSPFAIWLVISFIQVFINIFYIVYALSLEEKNCLTLFGNSRIILAGIAISLLNTVVFVSCVLLYYTR